MNKTYAGDLQLNALRALHPLCRSENFRSICIDEHKFPAAILDTYIKEAKDLLDSSMTPTEHNWAQYVNACGSITAFVDCFPERLGDFREIIISLIGVCKDKTDATRKSAAVLLAKLAKDEENSKHMRANHGFDVLLSLRSQFPADQKSIAPKK
jgi:hypothetical protein